MSENTRYTLFSDQSGREKGPFEGRKVFGGRRSKVHFAIHQEFGGFILANLGEDVYVDGQKVPTKANLSIDHDSEIRFPDNRVYRFREVG